MNVDFEVTFLGGVGTVEIETTAARGGAKGGSGGGTQKLVFQASGVKSLMVHGKQAMSIFGVSPPGGTTINITWAGGAKSYSYVEGFITGADQLPLTDPNAPLDA